MPAESWKKAKEAEQARPEPERCKRCLERKQACICLELDLEDHDMDPEQVVWVMSRPARPASTIKQEKKHKYEKACREVERLNRLYADKVVHFLVPVAPHEPG